MAENADGSEKSEEPTEKKLKDARDKGQVPRSKELTTLLLTLSAALFFMFYGKEMLASFKIILTKGLSFERSLAFDQLKMFDLIGAIMLEAVYLILPFLLLMMLIALVAPLLLGGWSLSAKAMAPKISKLNPVSGLKRMFSTKALMELFKAFAKFSLVMVVAVYFLYTTFGEVLALGIEPLHFALGHAGTLIVEAFIFVCLSLLIVAAIDVPFQLYEHNKQLKMTKQEVKEEYKQQEGNPEVKGRIRQVQHEMSQRRMMQKVPDADVIITNPTHFAVALQYDPDNMQEPIVLASGADFMAAQIRTIATANNITIVEAPPLARALYYNAEIDRPIPYDLFKAVAAVLAYVYQLKEYGKADNLDFSELPIPENMQAE
ncbi:MAG: flagellar biosynthesis protein FlhB [Pseudomonadota bacterium]